MPLDPFKESRPLTLGVELELQLVSLSDLDLVDASPDLLDLLERRPFPGNVVPEITQSMIEVSTTIHEDHAGLLTQLRAIRDTLVHSADRLNVGICGGGTHPFQDWSARRIYAKPRFLEVSKLYGYLAKQFTVFGQHIHIGCPSADEALRLLHALNRFVPQFIALSASSPCVQRHDTLFHSARLNSVSAFPLSGRAPFFLSWADFSAQYFAHMERTGIVSSMKDFYWDIRPKPEYGTIELRVCDTPLDVERAAALAGYLQAICRRFLNVTGPLTREDDYLVYGYNRFQACRFGLDGNFVHPRTLRGTTLRDDIASTLEWLAHAPEAGEAAALEVIQQILDHGNDASHLRARLAASGSPEGVVDAALTRFRMSAP